MSARRTRRRASARLTPPIALAALFAALLGLWAVAELVHYALPLLIVGLVAAGAVMVVRRWPRATAAYSSARKTRAGRPAERLAQAAGAIAERDQARAELAEAIAERDEAREAAHRAWDSAADAGYAPPCPECGTLVAYLHDATCSLAGSYQRRSAGG